MNRTPSTSCSLESAEDSTQHTPETGITVVEVQRKRTRNEFDDDENSGSPSPERSPTEQLGKLKPQRLTYDAPVETNDEGDSCPVTAMSQPENPSVPSSDDGDLEEGEIPTSSPVSVLAIAG